MRIDRCCYCALHLTLATAHGTGGKTSGEAFRCGVDVRSKRFPQRACQSLLASRATAPEVAFTKSRTSRRIFDKRVIAHGPHYPWSFGLASRRATNPDGMSYKGHTRRPIAFTLIAGPVHSVLLVPKSPGQEPRFHFLWLIIATHRIASVPELEQASSAARLEACTHTLHLESTPASRGTYIRNT